jgi:plastocyanin
MLLLTGLLGAGAVVLPAVASSEAAPAIEAVHESGLYGGFRWKPATATVNAPGVVSFSNPSEAVSHGVEWRPGAPTPPSCTAGVPVGTSAKKWSGTCTFSQPGKYEFWCTVHGQEMSGTVTVSASGTTTTTTAYSPPATSGSTSVPGYAPSPPEGSPAGTNGSAFPLAGSATRAVKLLSRQRGASVRGSLAISQAGAGGSLEVDLLAKSASLASAGHATQARVGKLVLSHLHAGKLTFSVPLNGRGRTALRRHRRLALSARIAIRPVGGSAVTVTRGVVLHA